MTRVGMKIGVEARGHRHAELPRCAHRGGAERSLGDDAGRKLSACLNTDKREKLDLGELRLIRCEARKAGVHILAHYEARDAGYSEPLPLNPEDEAAQLQREFIASVKALESIQARLVRVSA